MPISFWKKNRRLKTAIGAIITLTLSARRTTFYVRVWRQKSNPALKELTIYNGRRPITYGLQIKQKELTKSFRTFSNWKRPFSLYGLNTNISALWKLRVKGTMRWGIILTAFNLEIPCFQCGFLICLVGISSGQCVSRQRAIKACRTLFTESLAY